MFQILIPLANASEEMEAITIIDALRRANADVVVASPEDGVEIVARHNTRIVTDVLLDAAADQQFDLIIVPASRKLLLLLDVHTCILPSLMKTSSRYSLDQGGMPGAKTLAGKEKLVALLKKQAEANRPYASIGAATAQVLEPHGLLKVHLSARRTKIYQ